MKKIYIATVAILSMMMLSGCVIYDPQSDLKVINKSTSNTNIEAIFYKRTVSYDWGNDKLVSSELAPGKSKTFTLKKCDKRYDVKVVYLDDTVKYKRNFKAKCGEKIKLIFQDN